MLRISPKLGLATVVLGAVLISLTTNALTDQGDVADFTIHVSVDRKTNTVSFRCDKGCAWETLSFGCEENEGECASSIDGWGTPAK